MGTGRFSSNNRFIMALCVSLAAPTNHSLGEVVYRKVTAVKIEDSAEKTCETPPTDAGHESSEIGLRVVRVTEVDGQMKVLLDGGQNKGVLPGTLMQTQRLSNPDQLIPTALLKALEVRETYTLAQVTANGSEDSQMHFPDYPGIMKGDFAVPQNVEIIQKTQLLPNLTLTYQKLFVDPKAQPTTYELSPEGRQVLAEKAKVFTDVRAGLLIVEAHTDQHGDRESNQLESLQRALTIRQVLIEELGLDPDRIAAIGMGESEPLPESYLPGRDDESRRILLKVKTLPPN